MGNFYDLLTFHGTALVVRTSTGTVLNSADPAGSADLARLTAFFPERQRNMCLLLPRAAVEPTLKIDRQEFAGSIPLRAVARDAAGTMAFYNPITGLHLCAAPPDGSSGIGGVSLDRSEIAGWERFALREVPAIYVMSDAALLCAQFEELLQAGLNPEALIGLLQRADAGAHWMPAIEALTRLMPLPQITVVAEWLMDSPDALHRLAGIYPEDYDAIAALPRLREWLNPLAASEQRRAPHSQQPGTAGAGSAGSVEANARDEHTNPEHRRRLLHLLSAPVRRRPRRAAEQRASAAASRQLFGGRGPTASSEAPGGAEPQGSMEVLPPELDFLAGRGALGEDVSFPHVCNALLRQAVRPKKDVCIVATARNEGLYLLEWIAYHRLIGVQSFLLYTNDNCDGSDELVAALHNAGVITCIRSVTAPGAHVQAKAYGHAMSVLPDILDFCWALVIDLDEFFTCDPDSFASIQDYIAWQEVQSVHAVALNWVVLSSGGEVRWRDEPVMRRFDKAFGTPALFIKTMSRPHRFIHSEPHFPIPHRQAPFIFCNSDRGFHEWGKLGTAALSDRPIANHAWINHYFFKSAEEFLCKWARGRTIDLVPRLTNEVLTPEFVKQFVDQHVASTGMPAAKEARAIQQCAADLDAEIARLTALPGVAAAADRIKENYRSQIGGIVEMFASAPGIVAAGEAGARFLQLFRSAAVAAEAAAAH